MEQWQVFKSSLVHTVDGNDSGEVGCGYVDSFLETIQCEGALNTGQDLKEAHIGASWEGTTERDMEMETSQRSKSSKFLGAVGSQIGQLAWGENVQDFEAQREGSGF